jgi:hypothetical protein
VSHNNQPSTQEFYDIIEASYFGPEALNFMADDHYTNHVISWKIVNNIQDKATVHAHETYMQKHVEEKLPESEIFIQALIKNRERQLRAERADG